MRNNRGEVVVWTLVLFLLFWFTVNIMGITNDASIATKALDVQEYSDVRILDHKWFMPSARGCGRGDLSRFDAEAINPLGKRVRVFVCVIGSGGATVRSEQ